MNIVDYTYYTITKLLRRTLYVPFERNPNEILVLGRTEIRRKESRRTLVPSTFFKYEENNKRHCFTDQIQYTHDARFNPPPFPSFQFFNTLGESSHDRSSIKANEELAWILTRNPDFYLLQRDNARAVKKSGDVPTRGRNFFSTERPQNDPARRASSD